MPFKYWQGHDEDEHPVDWSSYARLMKDHDDAMVRAWKEEIDTLLVFVRDSNSTALPLTQ